ncbi:MAG: ribosome maturation factor RimP [Acidobacteriota bacterium]
MPASRDDIREHVQTAAARVAASYGLEIFDVQIRREAIGWVVRVVIDRPDPGAAASLGRDGQPVGIPGGEPVGIEDCQHVSRDLSALLDVEEDLTAGLDKGFTLEVSSPGLDRPLRGEADYRRFVGRLAKIVTREPVDGQSHFAGRLAGVEDGRIVMTEGRRTHRVPMDLVSRARLEIEF